MKKYIFKVKYETESLSPKGLYYQGKYVILVGCVIKGHTMRRKLLADRCEITITKEI